MDFDRLDAILKSKKISRRKLAIAVGIPESTMSTAFMRRSGLSSDDVLKIAKYLKVKPYYLEGWSAKIGDEELIYHDDAADYITVRNVMIMKGNQEIGEITVSPDTTEEEALEEYLMLETQVDQYDPNIQRIIQAYERLNSSGQLEAVKRIEELTEIPRYTKSDEQGE